MVVVHMNLASGYGGGEIQVSILAKALAEKNITQYGFFKKSGAYIKVSPFKADYVLNFKQLISLIRKEKDNIILHVHDGRAVHLATFLKILFGVKVIITRKMERQITKKISKLSYKKADKIIAVSNAVKRGLSNIRDDVSVIFDSYPELKYDETFERNLDFGSKIVVTQIANFLPVKNHEMTIELAKKCQDEKLNVQFLLVGKGPELECIKQKAQCLQNIHFTGFTPFIGSVLNKTNILFSPSHSEGLGTAVIEAYTKGIPIVASAVGGQLDLVLDKETGFLIHNNTVNEYFDAIELLVSEPEHFQKMKENIAEHLENFTPEKLASNYYDAYCQLM